MRRYLITGASGWLGINLLDDLINGHADCLALPQLQGDETIRVLVFAHEQDALQKRFGTRIECVVGDITDPAAIERFCSDVKGATLVHLAGLIHPKRASADFDKVNYKGTKNLIETANTHGIAKAVVMSSNSPIGCNPNAQHRFTEESPYAPYMGYGKSKMKMELFLRACMASGNFMPITIIRAPWFYGPNQPPRQKEFFTMIRDGKGPIIGSGNNQRSMAYVGNLTQGILLCCAKAEANNQIFWIADETPYSMHQIMDTIERLLETEFQQVCVKKRLKLPDLASEVAWMIDYTLQAVGLYHQKIHVLSELNKNIACSVEKAKTVLGYNPAIALEEGMRRSLREISTEPSANAKR